MPSTEGFKVGGLFKLSLNFPEVVALLVLTVLALGLVTLGASRL
jgi:hypothetical protein